MITFQRLTDIELSTSSMLYQESGEHVAESYLQLHAVREIPGGERTLTFLFRELS